MLSKGVKELILGTGYLRGYWHSNLHSKLNEKNRLSEIHPVSNSVELKKFEGKLHGEKERNVSDRILLLNQKAFTCLKTS